MPPTGPERGYLKEIYELTKENNKILHRMHRNSMLGGFLKFFWWILILFILPAAAYFYYLKPYVEQVKNAYEGAQNTAVKVQALPDTFMKSLSDFFARLGIGN